MMHPGSGVCEPQPFVGLLPAPETFRQVSARCMFVAGRLLAGAVRLRMRTMAHMYGLKLTLEESKSLLDVTFLLTIEGPEHMVRQFYVELESIANED